MSSQRPYILAETNWKKVKKTNFELAVLPWGATEAHNYHLPYATDNYQADYVAAASAKIAWKKKAKVIVLPCIPFEVNTGQLEQHQKKTPADSADVRRFLHNKYTFVIK